MTDRTVPNLPSRDFDATEAFYSSLGFERTYRDDNWMILTAGAFNSSSSPTPTSTFRPVHLCAASESPTSSSMMAPN
jgi:catechol 2,3-dioxygenase-like lactoylglutathione lyase family enzyme